MLMELILYYTAMTIVSVRLFGAECHRKRLILSYLVLFIPLLVMELTMNVSSANTIGIWFFVPEVLALRLCLSSVRIRTLLAEYFSLYTVDIIITAALLTVLPFDAPVSWLLELAIHILMLCVCLLACYGQRQFKVRLVFAWTPKSTKRILLVLLACNAYLSVVLLHAPHLTDPVLDNTAKAAFLVLLLTDGLIVSVLLVYTVTNRHIRRVSDQYEAQLQAQSDYYRKLAASGFELRRFRHDSHNLFVGLEKLLSEGRTQDALEMLHHAQETQQQSTARYNTGNAIVDALLEDKSLRAQEQNTRITFEGMVPPDGIQPTDLCVIFGNTLDNALDACGKLPPDDEKVITIVCCSSSGFLFIDITNPVDKPVVMNGSLPATTKKDKTAHGFGLYSLDKSVKHYHGTLQFTPSPQHITLSLTLELTETSQTAVPESPCVQKT